MSKSPSANPTIVVIFGITGDLSRRKLLPALRAIARAAALPQEFHLVGVTRKQGEISGIFSAFDGVTELSGKTSLFHMDLSDKDAYGRLHEYLLDLGKGFSSSPEHLHYLSIPPHASRPVIEMIGASPLGQYPKTKLLLEKPFGVDLASAEEITKSIATHFDETQIYRIDHYLAKEMMRKAIDDASHEKGIVWNKVTWYSWTLAIVLFFVAIPALAFYIGMEYQKLKVDEIRAGIAIDEDVPACTEEAKVCADGSSVFRTGPNCDFPDCPSSVPNTPPIAPKKAPSVTSVPPTDGSMTPSASGRPEIKGTVMMGPMCTKAENKGQQSCKDQPYQKSLEIWTTNDTFVKSIAVSIYGTFQTELTPGSYVLRLPKASVLYPRIVTEKPFTVAQGKTTQLFLMLDTGIR